MKVPSFIRAAVVFTVLCPLSAGAFAAGPLDSFAPVPLANWQARNVVSLLDLARPLTQNFPESLEGRQGLSIKLGKRGGSEIIIDVTRTGLLDDSVTADMHRIIAKQTSGGWEATSVGVKRKCARGRNTGWTTSTCK